MIRTIFLLSTLCLSIFSFANDNEKLGLVPQPKKVTITDTAKHFNLLEGTVIYYEKELKNIAVFLKERIKVSTGFNLTIKAKDNNVGGIVLSLNNLNANDDAYTLVSNDDGVVITGINPKGVFWGVQTLLQLLPPEIYAKSVIKNIEWRLPYVEIEDEPLFTRFRGMHIDISRHFRTKEELMETIDMLAMHKMNTLHLHFSDDEGWRIESKIYPKLHEVGSIGDKSSLGMGKSYYLSQDDVKEIIAYANAQYINVFPEIDMPGHMHAVIRSYPELASSKDDRKEKKVIRIDEKGQIFCKNILREINALFKPTEIHLGFDEINFGADIYTNEEITGFAETMAEFTKKELGVTPILWDDVFEKGLNNPQYLAHWWRYGKIHWWKNIEMPMEAKFQKNNQPYILSPGNYTYLDMSNIPGSPGAAWAGTISVAQIYAWDPFLDLTNYNSTKRHLAQGIICATWSEGIKTMEIFEERVYPRLATISEKCWSQPRDQVAKLSWEDYRDNILQKQLRRYDILGVNYWSKDNLETLKSIKAVKKQ